MSVVSPEEVRRVAHLARLELSEQELATLAGQLDEILAYVQQLQAIPTHGVEPTSHVVPLANVMRPDQTAPCLTPDETLALAPARHGQLIKVPKIVEL